MRARAGTFGPARSPRLVRPRGVPGSDPDTPVFASSSHSRRSCSSTGGGRFAAVRAGAVGLRGFGLWRSR
eukprot:6866493-Lingulodinium_polyedra.AAC.1